MAQVVECLPRKYKVLNLNSRLPNQRWKEGGKGGREKGREDERMEGRKETGKICK
jgi:hypothetical protein